MRVHVDTDFVGDPDDAGALAMLLGWPGVEVVGISTNLEVAGRRAGCVAHYLGLAGRVHIPLAAGAEVSLTTLNRYEPTWGDPRYWPQPLTPCPSTPGAAVDLLLTSIEGGATIIAIGAFANLAILELMRPGSLQGVSVVAMAGWLAPAGDGFPDWGPEMEFNVQCDTRAAEIVAGAAKLTLVPLTVAIASESAGT